MRVKKVLPYFLCIVLFFIGFAVGNSSKETITIPLLPTPTPVPTPLANYTIDRLSSVAVPSAQLEKRELLKETKDFSSHLFEMTFDPTFAQGNKKKVTGVLNIPKGEGPFPLIIMLRGYVDPTNYISGTGTKNGAEYFASRGYMTIAPDFLGYAGSDKEAGNIFEVRFQTYTTTLSLLNSIPTPGFSRASSNLWDGKNIFIWAHSNGGQIALTTLAATREAYPTVLWAPVTKPFPYSVLYYTDESADQGKLIRRELAKFETLYDVSQYTFTNYLNQIHAPLQFSQGTADDAVPFLWTRSIVNQLRKQDLEVTYNEYPGADHNLRPAWNDVIAKDLIFFEKWRK